MPIFTQKIHTLCMNGVGLCESQCPCGDFLRASTSW
jgi:hypothetical protein